MGIIEAVLSTAAYGAVIFISYCLLVPCYRIWFHPLKDYPGPLLARISDSYGGFYALGRRLHLATFRDHKKYGPVMRHGPNKLIFSSPKAAQDIYNNERVNKSRVYLLTLQASGVPSIFNVLDRRMHQVKRKLIGQAVSERAMRMFEPTMTEQIDIFLGELLALSSKGSSPSPVNMTDRCKRLGIDIIGLLAFGYELKTQTEETHRFIIKGITGSNYRSNCFLQWPLPKKMGIDQAMHFLTYGLRQRYFRMLQGMISARLSQDKHAKVDLLSFVADSIDTGGVESIGSSELWSEAVFFFPAGGDTTSTALSALFFYLSRNPEAYRKLADEVRGAFTSGAEIRGGPQLAGCRYLRACVDEALRMSPPVSGTLWRELCSSESEEPFIVDGYVVPPGTQVGVNIYTLHHNEEYFPEPFVFSPERWLTEDEDALKAMNAAFAPFSIGARSCAGKPMAYLESSLVVAKTLWYFDFDTALGRVGEVGEGVPGKTDGRGRKGEFQLYDIFAATHDGPNLVFHPRGDFWKELGVKS
ncbi:cytochrome P450 [Diplogelasinospora grovesii]|uniref:Cytochrome P450 n=1 Tax=Diplogelasinospora grovesii TaxID=303347 RepID=A0AAN6N0W1_9PEZI|nr:cytochrome P450 [Diplogelasinospora grovesii]